MAITNVERQRNYLTFERAAECFSEAIGETVGVADLLNMMQEEVVPLSIWLPVSTTASRCVFKTETEMREAESQFSAHKWYCREIMARQVSYAHEVQLTKQHPYSLLNLVRVNKGILKHSKDLNLYYQINDTSVINGVFDVTAIGHSFEAVVEGLAIGGGYEKTDMDFLTLYDSSLSRQVKRYRNSDDESMVRVFDDCDIFVLTENRQVWIDVVDFGLDPAASESEVRYEFNSNGNAVIKTINDTVCAADTMYIRVAPPDRAFFCIRPESLEILIDIFKEKFNQDARDFLSGQPETPQKPKELSTRKQATYEKIIRALLKELSNKGVSDSQYASIIIQNSALASEPVPESTVYAKLKEIKN